LRRIGGRYRTEAFFVAYRRREHFDNAKDFGKRLRGIARNLVMNERRKEARHTRILCGSVTDMLLENQQTEATEEPADTRRLVQAMNDCIAQLPERSRDLLHKDMRRRIMLQRWRAYSECDPMHPPKPDAQSEPGSNNAWKTRWPGDE